MFKIPTLTPRQYLIVAHDLIATAVAILASFFIRFEDTGLAERLDGLIRFLPGFSPIGCCGTTMVACGLAPWWTRGCCISTREELICLPQPKAYRTDRLTLCLKIGKAIFGWRPTMASIGFATSPSPRFPSSKVCRAEGFLPL